MLPNCTMKIRTNNHQLRLVQCLEQGYTDDRPVPSTDYRSYWQSFKKISASLPFGINTIDKSMISNMEDLVSGISVIFHFIRQKKISVLISWASTFCFGILFFGLIVFSQFVRQGRITNLCLYYRLKCRLSGWFWIFSLIFFWQTWPSMAPQIPLQ